MYWKETWTSYLLNWDSGALSTKSSVEMFYSHHKRHPRGAGNKNRCLEMSYFYHSHSIHLQVDPVCWWDLQKKSILEKIQMKNLIWRRSFQRKFWNSKYIIVIRKSDDWNIKSKSIKGGSMYFSLNVNRMFPQKVFWIFNTSPLYSLSVQSCTDTICVFKIG